MRESPDERSPDGRPFTPADYGPAHPDELSAIARLARLGFGQSRDLFDYHAALFGLGTIRRLLHRQGSGHTVAACAAHWSMKQWFGGRPVPVQAVAMVAVDPALRGTGHGSALMRALLMEERAAGAALSVLCPSTLPFYRRLGYGRGGITCQWSAPPAAFIAANPAAGKAAPLCPADPLDGEPLAALRLPLLADGNGLPERTEAMWTHALCPNGEQSDLYRNEAGYIAITPPQDRRLTVADLCLPASEAIRPAMTLLAGFQAQVDRVTWLGGPDDPLALLAGDGVTLDMREEWLVRPLDPVHALEARGYPPELEESAVFEIDDPLFSDNCGVYHLEVAKSVGSIARTAQVAEPAAQMRIDAFASLFTGHASARSLWRAGLLHGEEKMIDRLHRIFCGAPCWMPDRF
ncbi:GNAT family N-acetyltransferase [Azospirillum sp. 412522]|nr:GNAT family N-acetyltransferase [Azospirillum sp. 412522]MBY6260795.1 GNAT family N-acetyltransferase [Azospirillum sp. 412522]